VLIAEIETGTRYRATAYATETDYGVVLADRVVWMPVDLLGEHFGRLTDAQRDRVSGQIVAVLRSQSRWPAVVALPASIRTDSHLSWEGAA
jgi:hypothetical protein